MLARKPAASTSLAMCRLVRGGAPGSLEEGAGAPEPILPGSRGDGGSRELGEEVGGDKTSRARGRP